MTDRISDETFRYNDEVVEIVEQLPFGKVKIRRVGARVAWGVVDFTELKLIPPITIIFSELE
jgi:hypothetical protein